MKQTGKMIINLNDYFIPFTGVFFFFCSFVVIKVAEFV